jgi:hypothetical protein
MTLEDSEDLKSRPCRVKKKKHELTLKKSG